MSELRIRDYRNIAEHESRLTGAELDLRMQWHESDMIDGAVFREAVCESIMGMQNPQELYRLFIAGSPMFGEILRKLALRYIDHQAEALADAPLFFEPEPIRNRELLA